MSWTKYGIDQKLITALESNNFMEPTEVQRESLRVNFKGDMIISARTGQGKTLCFLIPILQQLITAIGKGEKKTSIHTLIMTPTRELALQIKEHCEKIIPKDLQRDIRICPLIGGMSA